MYVTDSGEKYDKRVDKRRRTERLVYRFLSNRVNR